MFLMQLGEVIYGGVGSGLYGMLIFAIIAVFVAGLMVGRTPEYLGKKIESFEMKMASIGILVPLLLVLVGTAIAVSAPFAGSQNLYSSVVMTAPGGKTRINHHGPGETSIYIVSQGPWWWIRVRSPGAVDTIEEYSCLDPTVCAEMAIDRSIPWC